MPPVSPFPFTAFPAINAGAARDVAGRRPAHGFGQDFFCSMMVRALSVGSFPGKMRSWE